jgi:hypothetical protein
LRKRQDRLRQERRRRERGVIPRAQYLEAHAVSRTKPWKAAGMSRSSWYRHRRTLGTSPSAAMPTLKDGTSPSAAPLSIHADTLVPTERPQGDFRGETRRRRRASERAKPPCGDGNEGVAGKSPAWWRARAEKLRAGRAS